MTFHNTSFRILAVFTLVFTFGINLVQGQMFYPQTFYALKGNTVLSTKLTGAEGTVSLAIGVLSIPLFTCPRHRHASITWLRWYLSGHPFDDRRCRRFRETALRDRRESGFNSPAILYHMGGWRASAANSKPVGADSH